MTVDLTNSLVSENSIAQKSSHVRVLLDSIRASYYCCSYNEALSLINELEEIDKTEDQFFEMSLLKSHCLYELHYLDQSRETIETAFSKSSSEESVNCLYARGTLSYFDGQYRDAQSDFSLALQISKNPEESFKSLLGLGNTFYSLKEYRNVFPYLKELALRESLVSDDFKISYYLLCANTYLASQKNLENATKYFEQAYELSILNNWNYFSQRSLYGLACLEQTIGNKEKLLGILSILNLRLRIGESKYLSFLVNQKFEDEGFHVQQKIDFQDDLKSIKINERQFSFSHSPLMFSILKLLSSKNIFFSKLEIATHLWPNQVYKKRTHDPRIYDLIKRIRKIVELEEKRPLVILSNPLGYKLAIH